MDRTIWVAIIGFLLLGVTGPAVTLAQPVVNQASLLRCTSLGTRQDALEELDVPSETRETVNELFEDAREDINELNREYQRIYRRLEQALSTGGDLSDREDLAEEAGELEGERTARYLVLEGKIRRTLEDPVYQRYLSLLRSELASDVEERVRTIVERNRTGSREIPVRLNVKLDRDPVNFCPALPQS